MSDQHQNETYTRLLHAAAELFSKRGYAAVTLRDIAAEVGIHHASLYYYVKGGKEQLFIEVMERSFHHHREGLTQAIADAGDDLRKQLYAVARWFASQPPLSIGRMGEADMRVIDHQEAERLMMLAYDSLRTPILAVLERAEAAGEITASDLDAAAMALVSLAQSVHDIPSHFPASTREQVAYRLVDMLLDGLRKR